MSDSNQIRINELARELEIKAKVLIDYLPEVGVKEKKTHSSSIEVEQAELVRKHFLGLAAQEAAAEAAKTAAAKAKTAPRPAPISAAPAAAPAAKPAAPAPARVAPAAGVPAVPVPVRPAAAPTTAPAAAAPAALQCDCRAPPAPPSVATTSHPSRKAGSSSRGGSSEAVRTTGATSGGGCFFHLARSFCRRSKAGGCAKTARPPSKRAEVSSSSRPIRSRPASPGRVPGNAARRCARPVAAQRPTASRGTSFEIPATARRRTPEHRTYREPETRRHKRRSSQS